MWLTHTACVTALANTCKFLLLQLYTPAASIPVHLHTTHTQRSAAQLLQLYAPGGQRPLLPGPQGDVSASVARVETSGPPSEHFIQITNQVRASRV